MGFPQIPQAIAEAIGSTPQPDGKALLLRIRLSYVIKQGEVDLVPN